MIVVFVLNIGCVNGLKRIGLPEEEADVSMGDSARLRFPALGFPAVLDSPAVGGIWLESISANSLAFDAICINSAAVVDDMLSGRCFDYLAQRNSGC